MTTGRSVFDHKYAEIRDNIVRMGQLLDAAIERSLTALRDQDQILAQQVITHDAHINALRFTVEEECLTLIATQQPAASDLRGIIAAMNFVNDMERMADHATGIAKTVLRMENTPLLSAANDLPHMAAVARSMIQRCIDAFLARDINAAKHIAPEDDKIDNLYKTIFDNLLTVMRTDPTTVTQATYILWCAHNLERIGDRATNLAERVVFMTTGMMEELNLKGDNAL
jgi:phosphate transport system protein